MIPCHFCLDRHRHVVFEAVQKKNSVDLHSGSALRQDLAFVVAEDVPAAALAAAMREAGGELLREVRVFDALYGATRGRPDSA